LTDDIGSLLAGRCGLNDEVMPPLDQTLHIMAAQGSSPTLGSISARRGWAADPDAAKVYAKQVQLNASRRISAVLDCR
jgi:hypothetical protein